MSGWCSSTSWATTSCASAIWIFQTARSVCFSCLSHRERAREKCIVFSLTSNGHTYEIHEQLKWEAQSYHAQRRAEWRHHHDDHSLCRPEFVLGCTPEEH